jgi:hypothetical protein
LFAVGGWSAIWTMSQRCTPEFLQELDVTPLLGRLFRVA